MRQLYAQRVIPSENLLVRELSGEAVMLDLDREMYFGLDEIGYRMWTVLTSANSVGAAYEQLISEYEVAPDELWESIEALISQCADQGLLQLSN